MSVSISAPMKPSDSLIKPAATATSAPLAASGASSTPASSSTSMYFPDPYDDHHILDRAKLHCADLVLTALPAAFPALSVESLAALRGEVVAKMTRPTMKGRGEWTLPCFIFNKKADAAFTLPPPAFAAALQPHLQATLTASPNPYVERTEAAAAYLNFYLTPVYLTSVIPLILNGSYLAPLPYTRQPKVMVEYSQPNTSAASHTRTTPLPHTRTSVLTACSRVDTCFS